MSILYVGDIHGQLPAIIAIDRFALEMGVDAVFQVGDFGLGWPGDDPLVPWFKKRARQGRPGPVWYTCGGNHDNWQKWLAKAAEHPAEDPLVPLVPGCVYVRRGARVEIQGVWHAVLGGAESIDRHLRVEGKSWWPDETPSYEDFQRFLDNINAGVDVVVTHDAPLETSTFDHGDRENQTTPRTLQRLLGFIEPERRPRRWYFGHHHAHDRFDVNGIAYFCCGLEGEGFLDVSHTQKPEPIAAVRPRRWTKREYKDRRKELRETLDRRRVAGGV